MPRAAAVVLLVLQAASGAAQATAADRTIMVAPDDPAMAAAIDSARRTAPRLLELLASPPADLSYLSVKVPLTDGRRVEHVWLTGVTVAQGRLHGRIANDLEVITGWSSGDTVVVAPDSVSDWMAIVGPRVLGAFSVRLLRRRMSPAERAQFDQETSEWFVGPTEVQ